jgi:hypothetical protein
MKSSRRQQQQHLGRQQQPCLHHQAQVLGFWPPHPHSGLLHTLGYHQQQQQLVGLGLHHGASAPLSIWHQQLDSTQTHSHHRQQQQQQQVVALHYGA